MKLHKYGRAYENITFLFAAASLENPDSMLVYYVMLRGVDRFFSEYNTYPGEFDDQVEPDIVKLKVCPV